ncbi:hypothetical protein HNR77_002267 [Paenibacillus sp. JGP012]|nr:hypothetical protein [Paenibacillus sp. JGP012]
MNFLELGLIVVTVALFIVSAISRRKSVMRWGIASLLLLLILFLPSFVNGFQSGFTEGWTAR